MKLVALNKGLENKYGYCDEMEWKNDKFHGHQKGICVGIVDKVKEGEEFTVNHIHQNHLPNDMEGKDKLLVELVKDKNIVLVSDSITQLDGSNELVPREVLYLPYAVEGHSVFQPTVNFENIDNAINTSHHVKVELCFVIDGLNRYIVMDTVTHNVPIFELVDSLLDELDDLTSGYMEDEEGIESLLELGIKYMSEENGDVCEDGDGFYLDFYDEAGNTYWRNISDAENNLKNACVSMRLISIMTEIERTWDNGGETVQDTEH